MTCRMVLAMAVALPAWARSEAIEFPGPDPGKAVATLDGNRLVLANNVVAAAWELDPGGWRLVEVVDRTSEDAARAGPGRIAVKTKADDGTVGQCALVPAGNVVLERIEAQPESLPVARRSAGWRASLALASADGRLHADWQATIRDGAGYMGQQLTLRAETEAVRVEEVDLLGLVAPGAEVAGAVDGSPVVAGRFFFACEHPLADNRVDQGRVIGSARCFEPLRPGQSWTRTAVIGVAPAGQLRRAFQCYVERERPRPYRLFLHYNSWWDIAWPDRLMDERQCLDVIETFGRELVERRGVAIDSFVFDDGWDDPETLWEFHSGFPNGFEPLRRAAEKYGSAVGTWFSPWGGYGARKAKRLEYGKTQGFETNSRGFSLAGPKYYARYRDICAEMIRRYGANYFKFDGIARGIDSSGAGEQFAPDVEALLRLTTELRALRPDVYLSITTGTWPSPYWLWFGDSVWRNGHDWNAHGAGTVRQQWITYRMIVRRAPLYPINSLMTVTVCYAQLGTAARMAPDVADLVDEIRMAFGSGTQLLELYVTPKMMKPEAWDALAEAAKWSRENADVLVDVHWIGGDPGDGQPYGYASWSPRKGILVLRNPGEAPAEMALDLESAFELPAGAPRAFEIRSRWPRADRLPVLRLKADARHAFKLEPFEVLVLEATAGDR